MTFMGQHCSFSKTQYCKFGWNILAFGLLMKSEEKKRSKLLYFLSCIMYGVLCAVITEQYMSDNMDAVLPKASTDLVTAEWHFRSESAIRRLAWNCSCWSVSLDYLNVLHFRQNLHKEFIHIYSAPICEYLDPCRTLISWIDCWNHGVVFLKIRGLMEPHIKLYLKMLQHYRVRSHQVVLLDTYLLCSSACELGEEFPEMVSCACFAWKRGGNPWRSSLTFVTSVIRTLVSSVFRQTTTM